MWFEGVPDPSPVRPSPSGLLMSQRTGPFRPIRRARWCAERTETARQTRVKGGPGLVGYFGDGTPQRVVSIEVAGGSIRLVVNPEKLGNVPPLEQAEREERSG